MKFFNIAHWMGRLFSRTHAYPVDIKPLEEHLGYRFRQKDYLLLALTHRSYLNPNQQPAEMSNERLEFLGDAVLDLIVTDYLYRRYTAESEGVLSQKKSILVSRQVLGHLCDDLKLGRFMLINHGEEKTGGRNRLSNLANLFEALLGAIYLDGGYGPARDFVNRFLLNREKELVKKKSYFNFKSALLEYAQSRGWGFPQYRVVEESGPDHEKRFEVEVKVSDDWRATGKGRSKKGAEQMAAKHVLKKINPDEKITLPIEKIS